MSSFSRHRKKRLRDFKSRLRANGGPDRRIGKWEIIDIHEIPDQIGENEKLTLDFGILQEFDFYCSNQKDWYLLRLTKSKETKYYVFKPQSKEAIIYLTAELPFNKLNDELIGKILTLFEKRGIQKCRTQKIRLKYA